MNQTELKNKRKHYNEKTSYSTWNFGTINIRSGKEKLEGARMYMVTKEVARQNLLFCALQEVRHRNTGDKTINLDTGQSYRFIWCGQKKRRDFGVGILIKNDPRVIASKPIFNNPRVIALDIDVYGFKVRVVVGYSPTNVEKSIAAKEEFYRNLRKACKIDNHQRKLIVLGDFNAETDMVLRKTDFDETSVALDNCCNDNGERLKSHCRKFKLSMIQSFYEQPIEERYTWFSPDGKTKKVLDYIMAERFVRKFISTCKVIQEDKLDSDHRLLIASICTPTNKATRWSPRIKKEKKLNTNLLQDPLIRKSFRDKATLNLNLKQQSINTTELSENLVEAMLSAALETIPRQIKNKLPETWKSDSELNRLIKDRTAFSRSSPLYKELTKSIKKRVNKLKNEKLKEEADRIDRFATSKQIEEMYKSFKQDTNGFKQTNSKTECSEEKLKEFFKSHFSLKNQSNTPEELLNAPKFNESLTLKPSNEINTKPPDKDEILAVLKGLHNKKAANDIPPSFIKCAAESNEFMTEIVKLYKMVWATKKIPEKWGLSKLVAIWKGASKGEATDPKAYRALQIGSTLCKILVMMILERLRKWYDESLLDQQQGFRPKRGTNDGIYILKRFQQIANKTKKRLFLLFVDLSAAFDHVNRDWLFLSIKQRFPNNQQNILFLLLQNLYSKTQTAINGNPDQVFETFVGVRQGGPESPFLYNLYMDYVMRVFMLKCKENNIEFEKQSFLIPSSALKDKRQLNLGVHGYYSADWIGYADDIVLMFKDKSSLQRGIDLLNETFKRYQLSINVSKTKTMTINSTSEDYPSTIAQLNGVEIKNVDCFCYLGAQIHNAEHTTGDAEINFRIDSAENKFYQHGKKFMNKRISLGTRVQILNSLVRSRLTYGCQTWTLSARHESQLSATYNRMLRMMIRKGFKRKDDSWAFVLTNEDLYSRARTESVIKFIQKQQERYAMKIIRSDEKSLIKRVAFNSDVAHRRGRTNELLKSVAERSGLTPNEFYKQASSDAT